MIRHWHEQMQTLGVSSTHPLVAIRQLHLEDKKAVGGGRVYAKETRSNGRSLVPIGELDHEAEIIHQWLKRVREVDEHYFKAIDYWVRVPDFEEMAKTLHWSKSAARRNFDCGLAILQSHILDY